jgi:hypothetical protein
MWSRVFGGDRYITGQLDTSGWTTLGEEHFEGRNDHEVSFPGFHGKDVDQIALRPVNDDARCSNVAVEFFNGSRETIATDRILPQDRITMLNVPGNRRDVMRIGLTCEAAHGNTVTMQVMARG